tara:strand:- start:545 stop:661 length:117 start_codon:yes stop_codon:yes gene_type:complete
VGLVVCAPLLEVGSAGKDGYLLLGRPARAEPKGDLDEG